MEWNGTVNLLIFLKDTFLSCMSLIGTVINKHLEMFPVSHYKGRKHPSESTGYFHSGTIGDRDAYIFKIYYAIK